jgi:hypothetical protein
VCVVLVCVRLSMSNCFNAQRNLNVSFTQLDCINLLRALPPPGLLEAPRRGQQAGSSRATPQGSLRKRSSFLSFPYMFVPSLSLQNDHSFLSKNGQQV